MIVKAKELAGALKAAAMFASEDETRPHMNAVHLENVGGSALRLVATDGHTLWCCEISAVDEGGSPASEWNVPLKDVGAIVKALKYLPDVLGPGAGVEVNLVQHTVETSAYADAGEHCVPYASILPSATKSIVGKAVPEFATDYVARCCAAFSTYGKGLAPELPTVGSKYEKQMARAQREQFISPPIAFAVTGDMDPALFYSPKFPCAIAIVMPRKGEGLSAPVVDAFVNRLRATKRSVAA